MNRPIKYDDLVVVVVIVVSVVVAVVDVDGDQVVVSFGFDGHAGVFTYATTVGGLLVNIFG